MLGPTPAWQKTAQGRHPLVPLCSSEVRKMLQIQRIQGSSFNGIFNMSFTLITIKEVRQTLVSDVLSFLLFLFLKTNPDFETIYGVRNCVSNISTSASKSIMENGKSPQSPKDERQRFRGSTCTSPTCSDKLSPVSTPKGNKND